MVFELNEDGYRRLRALQEELRPRGVVRKSGVYLSYNEIELIQESLSNLMGDDYTGTSPTFKQAELLGYELTAIKNRPHLSD